MSNSSDSPRSGTCIVDTKQPLLSSARLVLRPLSAADAPIVHKLVQERQIASTTLNIPHPYEDGMAEAWIATHEPAWHRGEMATFAITEPSEGVVGAIGLTIELWHQRAEAGYWIGLPFWGRGYATEALSAIIAFGFEQLHLNRIHASHMTRNPASGKVMIKAGMRYEGCLRQHIIKWDQFEDLASYAILRSEFVKPGASDQCQQTSG
jgi:ribosomal-protein-alanine N-acetyltransferase